MVMGRVRSSVCRVCAGLKTDPARFQALGQKDCAGCAGCAGLNARAGAHLCGGFRE